MLFDKYARLLCRTAKLAHGSYTAEQLTYFVKQWPMPSEALALMSFGYDKAPIVFLDVNFQHMGRWMLDLLNGGNVVWPVGLMPTNHVDDWHEDAEAKMLAGYLEGEGMGVMMMKEDAILCRGEWVHPCDFRLTFQRGYTYA